jgi:hypothetical protein
MGIAEREHGAKSRVRRVTWERLDAPFDRHVRDGSRDEHGPSEPGFDPLREILRRHASIRAGHTDPAEGRRPPVRLVGVRLGWEARCAQERGYDERRETSSHLHRAKHRA